MGGGGGGEAMKWKLLQWPAVPHAALWSEPCIACRIRLPLSIWFGMSYFALEVLASSPFPSDLSRITTLTLVSPRRLPGGVIMSWREILTPLSKWNRTEPVWPGLCVGIMVEYPSPFLFILQIANCMDLGLCVSKSNWKLLWFWTGSYIVNAKFTCQRWHSYYNQHFWFSCSYNL